MQAKRIQVNEADVTVGNQVTVRLAPPVSPREEINYHNVWWSVSAEVITNGANAQGTWVLWVKTDSAAADVIWIDSIVNGELSNAKIIACGVWGASNESAFNFSSQLKTSRTLRQGEELAVSLNATGITSGSVSARAMICAHTTRK